MADIEDKMNALHFSASSKQPVDRITQLIGDAAEVAAAVGGKIVITQSAPGVYTGSVKNFVRVEHASFTVRVSGAGAGGGGGAGGGERTVQFAIDDYLRVRDTVLGFIPVSPWSAPAYKPLQAFTERLRSSL